ncbi:MAG: DUF4330 domain-containing protein [Firmicutes bacterium]|nr:DUF4330 domain-containing protein [Bacillota bacterium]
MRLIDERGRFLGLINVIDLLVVLAVLLAAGGVAYKLLAPGGRAATTEVEAEILAPRVYPSVAESVRPGDRLVAGSAYTAAEVKAVRTTPARMAMLRSDGTLVLSEDPQLRDLYVTVKGTAKVSGTTLTLAGQELRAGREFYVKSLAYEVKGTVLRVVLPAGAAGP